VGFLLGKQLYLDFFILHFLLPFILTAIIVMHLSSLHISGSTNPTGLTSKNRKINFHPYFSIKDGLGILLIIVILLLITLIFPLTLGDPENFNLANPLSTPIHIQPEWYFLFAYAILRSIPNKLGGVVGLLLSILIIASLTLIKCLIPSKKFIPNKKFTF